MSSDQLEELTAQLGAAYQIFKEAEKQKEELRKAFLEATEDKGDSFSYVNSLDGNVYTRSTSKSYMLDDERLQQEDPELYEAVTYVVEQRQLKQIEDLTADQQAALQPYMYAKGSVRFLAPRQASEEELGESQIHH